MKKLMTFLTAGWVILALNLSAQEFYLGAEEPEGFTSKKTEHQLTPLNGITCLPCALDEGEGDIPNDGEDVVNGGCNSSPPVFSPISIGDVYCGRTNTYTYFASQYRDTDWYKIVLTESKTLYWTGIGDATLNLLILSDDGNCGAVGSVAYAFDIPAGTVGQTSYTCGPGTWYFWVGLSEFTGYSDGVDYMVTLSEGPPPDPWCSSPPIPMPLSNWPIYVGISLILVFMGIRFRRLF